MGQELTQDELLKRLKQLEEENHFYRCLMDAFPVNIFVKDTECRYSITSRICDIANGVERGALKGKTDFDLQNSKEIAQNFYEDDQRIMRDKAGSRMFTPTLCGETIKYYDIFKEPILDEDGTVLGILGMVVDPDQEVLTTDKEKSGTDRYVEEYKNENNLMIDYDMNTKEAILLTKPMDFAFLPDRSEQLMGYLREEGYLDEETSDKIRRLFDGVREGKSECSRVIQFRDAERKRRNALLNVTAMYGKDEQVSRAICILRTIADDDVLEEQKKVIMKDVSAHFYSLMAESYEQIIYVSPMKDWYQVMKNSAGDGLAESGTYGEIMDIWRSVLYDKDWEQIHDLYYNLDMIKSGKRPGINTIRIQSRVSEGTYRWKEITIFMEASEDDERSFIIGIADVEDDVREENRIKRHDANKQIIDVLSTIVEYRDLESGEHIKRIENLSEILLREYSKDNETDGFTEEEIKIISAASAMHDIGKIAISDTILLKPGRLTKEEFESMKEHTVKGSELVQTVASIQDEDYAKYCYEICRYHHERYDGKGYPDGLAGDEIPISAQIVSVADVYDALVSKRCYKDAYAKEEAYNMIRNGECGTFSDKIMRCFENCIEQIEKLYA